MENEYLKKVECLNSKQGKIITKDKVRIIYELRHKYSVKALMAFAKILRSTYCDLVKKLDRPDRDADLKCVVRTKKYKSYKGKVGKIALDILNSDFKAEAPNEKWVTDITEFKLFGEKLYLSPVLNLFNGEIITYTNCSRPTYSLVSEMLEKVLERLPEEHQLLIHSDQGWYNQMEKYRRVL